MNWFQINRGWLFDRLARGESLTTPDFVETGVIVKSSRSGGLNVNATQQSKQGIGMGERIELRKQQPQVVLEHRPGDLPIGFTPGAVLEDKDQDPIKHQDGESVF